MRISNVDSPVAYVCEAFCDGHLGKVIKTLQCLFKGKENNKLSVQKDHHWFLLGCQSRGLCLALCASYSSVCARRKLLSDGSVLCGCQPLVKASLVQRGGGPLVIIALHSLQYHPRPWVDRNIVRIVVKCVFKENICFFLSRPRNGMNVSAN